MNSMSQKSKNKGFSLLEVMIAVVILGIALMPIINLQSTAVIASGRAQSMSVATALLRYQMAQLRLEVEKDLDEGHLSDDKTDEGDFSEIGFPDYRWEMVVRKIEIPAPPLPEEAGGELVKKIVANITEQMSKATREMKLRVYWKELEEEQSIDVTTHLVNLKGSRFGVN